MALKTSLVITGDSASATAALRDVEQGFAKAGTAATRSGAQLTRAANDVTKAASNQAFAVRNVGQQIGDFGLQVNDGASIARAFSNQIGQLGFAMSDLGGKAGAVGRFLVGPWGIALTIAAAVAAPFVEKLFQAEAAAEGATLATSGLSDAESILADALGKSSSKIAAQNTLLLINARLKAANLRIDAAKDAKDAETSFRRAGQTLTVPGAGQAEIFARAIGVPVDGNASVRALAERAAAAQRLRRGRGETEEGFSERQQQQFDAIIKDAEKADFKGSGTTFDAFGSAISKAAGSRANIAIATLIDKSLDDKKIAPELAKAGRTAKTPKPKASKAAALAASGIGISDRIADIEAQFSGAPTALKKANDQLRELEKIKAAIDAKPLLPGADALKARIEALGVTIQNSINKPFDDYLKAQRQSAEIDKLLLQGRNDEAAALQVIIGLQERQRPLSNDQLQSVLATVRADRQRSQVLRDQQALIQGNVQAVQSFRGALEQTVADALRGRFSLSAILTSIDNSAVNLISQRLVEQVFGSTLRSLEDQARGSNTVETAATNIAGSLGRGASAVDDFATTVRGISARIAGTPTSAANDNFASAAGADGVSGIDYSQFGVPGDEPDIVVKGARQRGLAGQGVAEQLISIVDRTLGAIGIKLPGVLTQGLKGTLGKLEKSLPSALAGAFTGATASRIILGDRGTGGTIGSSIGGAIGQKVGEKFLTTGLSAISKGLGSFAGPIGSIAGGLIGGLLGGLFAKAKFGTASVSNTGDGPVVGGNDSKAKSTASSLGDAVLSGVKQIADQLGAEVGDFKVSIGTFKDNFRVSTTGFTGSLDNKKAKGQGLVDFGKDGQDKAIAFAIADAIADGAILGVSPKVALALKSSPDINKALAEAVKTADLELALGGVGAQLAKEAKGFERTAADRLRIAKAYGFDLVKVEELNAKQRLALSEKLLKDQVGSLQELIDEITSGSLFEGSAVDQRTALLGKIDAARADANAGVEGAADKLAALLRQLDSVSRDAFATTGGFAADRQSILDTARDVIARANQRVVDAQKASDPALQKTNELLDEQTDQGARALSESAEQTALLKSIADSVAANGNDFDDLRRFAGF